MAEWIEYKGTDEQIAEIQNARHGYVVRMADTQDESVIVKFNSTQLLRLKTDSAISEYLICNPHPLADMIIRQAQTGQPVWCRAAGSKSKGIETNKVDWDDYRYEYSFTPFED